MFVAKRSEDNPILVPDKNHYWEEFATFNLSPIKKGKYTYGLYRAISAVDKIAKQQQISTIGICKSKDGVHFENRTPVGIVIGCSISNGKYFMLNIEGRLIDEDAVTISGDLRF